MHEMKWKLSLFKRTSASDNTVESHNSVLGISTFKTINTKLQKNTGTYYKCTEAP